MVSAPSLYEVLRDAIRAEEPVALATLISAADGAAVGGHLLIRPGQEPLGTLGDEITCRIPASVTRVVTE